MSCVSGGIARAWESWDGLAAIDHGVVPAGPLDRHADARHGPHHLVGAVLEQFRRPGAGDARA
jgi:hypothetical protein